MLTPFGTLTDTATTATYGGSIGYYNPFVLDKLQGAKMALSVRKLKTSYQGYYALIRKQNGSVAQKVLHPYRGFITPQAILENRQRIKTWLASAQAAGSIWYDQSGNELDATQNVATQQFVLRDFFRHRPAFMSRPNKEYLWNYSSLISPYLYGAGKQFTFHIVAKCSVSPSGAYRLFHHINSDGEIFNGFTISSIGEAQIGYNKVYVQGGDSVNCATICSENVYLNSQPIHIIIRYDGTVNTAWKDRLSMTINTKEEGLTERFLAGEFPAHLAQPTSTPRNWAPLSSINQSGTAEIIFWDRLLNDQEVLWLGANTREAYGL